MKTYRVYFRQINQQCYDVEARSEAAAITKAEREWKKENGPSCLGVAKQEQPCCSK